MEHVGDASASVDADDPEALAAVVQVEDAQLLRLVLCQEQVLVFCGAVIVEEQIGRGSL